MTQHQPEQRQPLIDGFYHRLNGLRIADDYLMHQVRRVLVPVDFSDCSRAAVEQAAWVTKQCGAELELLHVWQATAFLSPDVTLGGAEPRELALSEFVHDRARQELSKFVSQLSERGIAVKSAWFEQGQASQVIVQVASKENSDLLVMGTHGVSGIEHAVLGSVVEKVLRRAPCPVLSVRATPAQTFPRVIKRILVPVDYSDGSRRALSATLALAQHLRAEIDVVHVWDRPAWMSDTIKVRSGGAERPLGDLIHENADHEMTEFLSEIAAQTGSTLGHRLLSGKPAASILTELDGGAYDLVAIGTHGRGGLKHLLLGSVAEKLVRFAKVPVLTVPPAKHQRGA